MKVYGTAVGDKLDNGRNIIRRRYSRQHYPPAFGPYPKDLSAICSDLKKVFTIDNSPGAYRCAPIHKGCAMMTMDVTKTEPGSGGPNSTTTANQSHQLCAGCGKHIQDRYLLRALDLLWHEDCLKCGCCDCRLGEVGSTLYTKGNLMLCKRDYLRLFGSTGYCAACTKVIPAFEMVMRARNNVYHLECFACHQCNHRFCVGDRFYLCDNKILCEYDYEERLVFASMANHPMMKRQASSVTQNSPPIGLLGGGNGPAGNGVGGPGGPRTPGDHNNNGPQTAGAGGPFGTPTHMKTSLGTSS